jgi:hypothetical protein
MIALIVFRARGPISVGGQTNRRVSVGIRELAYFVTVEFRRAHRTWFERLAATTTCGILEAMAGRA